MIKLSQARKRDQNTFYCFSPPVMIATFIIEVSLALYALWRYKASMVTRLVVALLVFLGIFQLAEFLVCRGMGGDALLWSRIGFMSITMLPPLGIHLVCTLAETKKRPVIWLTYVLAVAFIGFFMFVGRSIDGHACLGNYVIFQVAPGLGGLYGLYYYVSLIAALGLGWYFMRHTDNQKTRKSLQALMFGYAIFLIPTTTVGFLSPETLGAIPSIMCGFAVLLALAVSLIVLPLSAQKK